MLLPQHLLLLAFPFAITGPMYAHLHLPICHYAARSKLPKQSGFFFVCIAATAVYEPSARYQPSTLFPLPLKTWFFWLPEICLLPLLSSISFLRFQYGTVLTDLRLFVVYQLCCYSSIASFLLCH